MNRTSIDPGPLLAVNGLDVIYPGVRGGAPFPALHDVSLSVAPGECVGLVGESGSGKTTLGKAVLGLAPVSAGTVMYGDEEISHASRLTRRRLASELQVVFQDPYRSMNPSMTVGDVLAEPLIITGRGRRAARQRVVELLDRVGLPADAERRYPGEFSGGQRQRIAIARALCRSPRLVVCDEPVSALDLTTQQSVLDLFIELQRDLGIAYLFVTHDLAVVRYVAHRVAVMRGGRIVEEGETSLVTTTPQHAYTRSLMLASPVADPDAQAERRSQRHAFARSAEARA
ncbi:ABC-type glutathione transport system ATPase component [Microbacterium sp. SORGH_AS 1204]|uniref:ABC transporter ATP-binding protein n=1 Tax=Microbacterium sp. SORGH_AS_1204 TaxID=3041785 RepID=UPI00278E87CC|nr:ATP-binding cassette domain-containing protein [Microbacterium sp. SORGH_AS_1204]MDQ1136306.1 ABC-type glutathione transport system ATPase component [Microbacterium sp. SORGH_AS_1204]